MRFENETALLEAADRRISRLQTLVGQFAIEQRAVLLVIAFVGSRAVSRAPLAVNGPTRDIGGRMSVRWTIDGSPLP